MSARIDGQCLHCLELLAACDNVDQKSEHNASGSTGDLPHGQISVRGLDLVTKRGTCLAQGICFNVTAKAPLLISGPNASGKSLLGSVLLGLWPAAGDQVQIAVSGALGRSPPLHVLMPAPQRIYLPFGTLAAQIAYPTILSPPTQPPFELRVTGFPATMTEQTLQTHFQSIGGTSSHIVGTTAAAHAIITFPTAEVMQAAAKQQQIQTCKLECELAAGRGKQPGDPTPNFAQMARCLLATGIHNVLLREPEGWLTERLWEHVLSGGEQQRLCLARVFYRKPTFALLDECTSMVAADAAEKLYRQLFHDWGVLPVMLTQRMFIPDLYKQELVLGECNAKGWDLLDDRS